MMLEKNSYCSKKLSLIMDQAQTNFNNLDLQEKISDRIDFECSMKGNLLLNSSETLPLVQAFMKEVNKKHTAQLIYNYV